MEIHDDFHYLKY